MARTDSVLDEFCEAYGRLCHLAARSLYDHQDESGLEFILEAFAGEGRLQRSDLVAIRKAWERAHMAMGKCQQARLGSAATNRMAYIALANQSEWGVYLQPDLDKVVA